MILEFNVKYVYTKGIYCFVFVFFLFTCACCLFFSLSGHINQVKQNLSKTPQELIPSVFINSWGKHKNIFYPLSWLVDLIHPAAACCQTVDSGSLYLFLMFSQVCQVHSKQLFTESWQPNSMSRLSEIPWAVGGAPAAEAPSLVPALGPRYD